MIRDKIEKVERENKKLQEDNERYSQIKEILVNAGFDLEDTWHLKHDLDNKMKQLRDNMPVGMIRTIKACISNLSDFADKYGDE